MIICVVSRTLNSSVIITQIKKGNIKTKSMKKKFVVLASLSSTMLVVGTLFATLKNSSGINVIANITPCSGNHYTEKHETFTSEGTNEMWLCCEHHELYTSIDEIPNYDANKWEDKREFPSDRYNELKDGTRDNGIIKSTLGDVTTYGNASIDTANSKITCQDSGFAISNRTYTDVSFTVNFSSAGANPYVTHALQNALLIGASYIDNKLRGFAIDVSAGTSGNFLALYYLYGNETSLYTSGNNVNDPQYLGGDHSGKNLNVSIKGYTLSITGDGVNVNWSLKQDNYADSYTTIGNICYAGGGIGFMSNLGSESSLTLTNLQYTKHVDYKKSSNNNWTVSSDHSFNTGASNGSNNWLITKDSYTNFSANFYIDRGASQTIWDASDPRARNSFVFGVTADENDNLTGYGILFETNYVYLVKFNGNQNSITYIDHRDYSGARCMVNIFINNSSLNVSYGTNTLTRNIADSYTYNGGSIGFFSSQVEGDSDYSTPYDVGFLSVSSLS